MTSNYEHRQSGSVCRASASFVVNGRSITVSIFPIGEALSIDDVNARLKALFMDHCLAQFGPGELVDDGGSYTWHKKAV